MKRIVLDTNSLVQIIPGKSRYRKIWEAYKNGEIQLCVTTEILDEYEEILQRLTNEKTAKMIIDFIANSKFTVFIISYYKFHLIKADPDDNKFTDCAVAANARCIVTEDKHFHILKQINFPKIDVITLDEFITEVS